MNIRNLLMYCKYYKKNRYLSKLKRKFNLDFEGRIENPNKDLRGYEGCYPVNKVLKRLKVSTNDSIIDVGCGKGLFLYYASKYQFKTITGIDIEQELIDTANKNIKIINDSRLKVECVNAFDYNYDDYNVFFINNPFSIELMKKFIDIIIFSHNTVKRHIRIVYQFPFAIDAFKERGFVITYAKYPTVILDLAEKK